MEIVGTASDGMETLALLSEEKPDVLLLDLVLPKLDGLEVLRRLPETGAKCRTIVLSGFVNNCSDRSGSVRAAAGTARSGWGSCRGRRDSCPYRSKETS